MYYHFEELIIVIPIPNTVKSIPIEHIGFWDSSYLNILKKQANIIIEKNIRVKFPDLLDILNAIFVKSRFKVEGIPIKNIPMSIF